MTTANRPARRALLLIGSAKPVGTSTSETLGRGLFDRLVAAGMAVDTIFLHRALRTPSRTQELLDAVDTADLVVVAFPLYVDTLPHLVTAAFEAIAARRRAQSPPHPEQAVNPDRDPQADRPSGRDTGFLSRDSRPTSLVAIINCGFPEVEHNALAAAVCEQFAAQAGFAWGGALTVGGGPPLGGQAMDRAVGLSRHVVAALDRAADALAAGRPLPVDAIETMAKPAMPKRVYLLMGTVGWHQQAYANGVHGRLHDRPFVKSSA